MLRKLGRYESNNHLIIREITTLQDQYYLVIQLNTTQEIYFFCLKDTIPSGYEFVSLTLCDNKGDLDSVNYTISGDNFYAYPSILCPISAAKTIINALKARIVYIKKSITIEKKANYLINNIPPIYINHFIKEVYYA